MKLLSAAVCFATLGDAEAWTSVHKNDGSSRKSARQTSKVARRHEGLLFTRGREASHSSGRSGSKLVEAMKIVHKTAYWGTMTLGTPPQEFKVIFDTGSGNLIVPASDCNLPGCAPHKKYNSKASTTSTFVTNEKGESSSEITFGTGQVSGGFYKDNLCMGSQLCFDARFIAADKMSTSPFQEIPFDGIMGLGFKDLSMGDGFNIVDDLAQRGSMASEQFSFYVTDGEDSEVTFGGYRPELLASDIVWAPVELQSWWQVKMDDITFNNEPKNLCGGHCKVAVDTGTSMLAGPSDLVDKLTSMVNAKEDCSNFDELPNIGFQLGNTVLNLKPDDYMDRSAGSCSFSLMALDVPPPKGPVFIFGDPFLRRFVTIYDRSKPAVGFAVAKHSGAADDGASGLIAHIKGGDQSSSSQSSPAASNGGANAVDLHLDAGLMTGANSGEGAEETPAPEEPSTPAAPSKEESRAASIEKDVFERVRLGKSDDDDNILTSTRHELSKTVTSDDASTGFEHELERDEMRRMLGLRSFVQKPQPQHGLVSVKLHRNK